MNIFILLSKGEIPGVESVETAVFRLWSALTSHPSLAHTSEEAPCWAFLKPAGPVLSLSHCNKPDNTIQTARHCTLSTPLRIFVSSTLNLNISGFEAEEHCLFWCWLSLKYPASLATCEVVILLMRAFYNEVMREVLYNGVLGDVW